MRCALSHLLFGINSSVTWLSRLHREGKAWPLTCITSAQTDNTCFAPTARMPKTRSHGEYLIRRFAIHVAYAWLAQKFSSLTFRCIDISVHLSDEQENTTEAPMKEYLGTSESRKSGLLQRP